MGRPYGSDSDAPYTAVRATALTIDRTRAYATLPGQGSIAIVDMVAMQQVDAKPGSGSCDCPDKVEQIQLPAGAQPFWIVLDRSGKYAYVSDERDYGMPGFGTGRIYVVSIDPSSPDFHRADRVRTIEVDSAGYGLRQLAVSDDGRRLYVAAPNREPSCCGNRSLRSDDGRRAASSW